MAVILSLIGDVISYSLLAVFVFAPAAGGLVLALVLVGAYLRDARRVLAPRPAPARDALIRTPGTGDGEPAYRSYYAGQVLTDMRSAARTARADAARILRCPAVLGVGRWLLSGRRQPGLPFGDLHGFPRLVAVLLGLAAIVAAASGIVLAAATATAIQTVHAALLALIAGLLAVTGLLLYGTELAGLAIRKIRMKCPHPDCYRHIALPCYKCPRGHEHRHLRPGVYGIFWRVCACGLRLPTALMLNRHQLEASCPRCARLVPQGLGSARLVHFPLVGGTSAGKSSLLTAMVAALESLPQDDGRTVEFASDASRQEYETAKKLLSSGQWPNKTSVYVPEAFMFFTGRGRKRRLVYLYDPRGEVFREADSVRRQQYLESASGIIFVVDPFSAASARDLPAADEQIVRDARPSAEDPQATYARTAGELGVRLGRRLARTPVAVIATKIDAVLRTQGMPHPAQPDDNGSVEAWLKELGLRNLAASLNHDFGVVRYWTASAYASTGPKKVNGGSTNAVMEPILWLLSQT
jgi:Double-GTPase 2